MNKEPLTAERLRELVQYDAETGHFTRAGKPVQRTRMANGYLRMRVEKTHFYQHRLAWLYVYGHWPAGVVDHINRDKTDNRIANLRDVSMSKNIHNAHRPVGATGFRGVYVQDGTWRARIIVDNKRHSLGSFSTPDEAERHYLAARAEASALHGLA